MATQADRLPSSDIELIALLKAMKGSDTVELKMTVLSEEHRRDRREPAHRPGGGAAAPGVLLRHAGPRS